MAARKKIAALRIKQAQDFKLFYLVANFCNSVHRSLRRTLVLSVMLLSKKKFARRKGQRRKNFFALRRYEK